MRLILFALPALAAAPVSLAVLHPTSLRQEEAKPALAAADPGEPIPGLSRAEEDLHIRGRRLFRWELWRPDRSALGINANECSKCHLEPHFGGSNKDPRTYVTFVKSTNNVTGFVAYHRFQRAENLRFREVQAPPESDVRRAPSLFGLGLLEAVPNETLQRASDPADANQDGISGRTVTIDGAPGRFGWKTNFKNIETFVIGAFKGELGMVVEPYDRADFEGLGYDQIKAVTYYIRTLSPPAASKLDPESAAGRAVFQKIGCASCHTPKLETGKSSIAALNRKTIEAYTDLLLHDVSETANAHSNAPSVEMGEYRTPALWGLGAFGGPYWHDGSAATVADAILKHSGEAKASRSSFEALPDREKKQLLNFLGKI